MLPTQSRHPWRATLRTTVAVAVGLLPLLPEILAGLHIDSYAVAGQVLVIAAGITRVLANPQVETLLHQYAPWLAAQPPTTP
jgi:predicted Kef-type K+ transport protein